MPTPDPNEINKGVYGKDPNDPKYKDNPDYYWSDGSDFMSGQDPAKAGWHKGGGAITQGYWDKMIGDLGKGADDLATSLGYAPKKVAEDAPGGKLDTSQADADRADLEGLVSQLQQQAATGGGAWEGSLKDATQRAQNSATSMAQSQRGGMTNAMDMGYAKGAAEQKSVGQGNILREQSKQGAQKNLSSLLTGIGQGDAERSAAKASAMQERNQLNQSLKNNAQGNIMKDTTSLAGLFSDGGEVPGKPKVFGDDERNDVVPAKLSPGEIVIPRTSAGSPEDAAAFVRALQARRPQKMAEGGDVGNGTGLGNLDQDSQETAGGREKGILTLLAPHLGAGYQPAGSGMQGPTIANGGLYDTANYDANRQAQLQNAKLMMASAQGKGPSVAPQMMGNSIEANMGNALKAQRPGQGGGNMLLGSVLANQQAAGGAANTSMSEQEAGQQQFSDAMLDQRKMDQALEIAKQQAAFRQTQINAGQSLADQAAQRQATAGAGQAFTSYSNRKGGGGEKNTDTRKTSDDYSKGGPADLHDSNDKWEGGVIEDTRGADFVAALKRRK